MPAPTMPPAAKKLTWAKFKVRFSSAIFPALQLGRMFCSHRQRFYLHEITIGLFCFI
jgi:hypothetical protein